MEIRLKMKTHIVTIATSAPGGIDSVINGYVENGLFENKTHTRITSHLGLNKWQDLYLFIAAFFKFSWLALTRRNLIVHCHMSYKGSFWRKLVFTVIAKLFHHYSIIHLHGSEFRVYFGSRSKLTKKLILWLIKHADEFVVLSQGWSDYIESISGRKARVINNYVDVCQLDLPRQSNQILFLGAFINRKGIYELLQACSELEVDFHLHLCGSGENKKVADLVSTLKLEDKITFHGWVNTEQKKALLSTCSVMILPTYNEGLPMTIIESMACGIPIITTPVGAIPEVIIEQQTGYLVEPGDVTQIREKLAYVLAKPTELNTVIKTANEVYQARFTSKVILPLWESVYATAKSN